MPLIKSLLAIALLCAMSPFGSADSGSDGAEPKPDAAKDSDSPAAPEVAKASSAQEAEPKPLLPAWLKLSAVLRGRYEAPSGTSVANATLDEYYLSRLRLEVQIKPTPWLRLVAQGQDARAFGYNAVTQPNTIYNPLDLRLAYAEASYEASTSVKFRAGRQELNFGGGRLVGTPDWGTPAKSYDAMDVTLSRGGAKLDLFAGSIVWIDPSRFDRHKTGEHLYGAYGSVKGWAPGAIVEPYVLFKQALKVTGEQGGMGDALLVTPGVRVAGQAPNRIDYTAEFAIQRGSYSADPVSAMAGSYVAGWTLNDSKIKPRVSLEYNHASGDKSAKDGARGTFDQLYASNHQYYGIADQVGWKNLRNPRIGFDFVATKRVKLRADFNEFYLATTQDGLYNASGTRTVLNTHASSRHVGSEADFQVQYQWSEGLQFGIGFARLFAGEYLKQSTKADGYSYPYVCFTKKF
ncbi:MAG: alginate export family protein [Acidobacteriia bacterium]|nr:alginate export family protein [Terriglobia bacterium]